jgi:hypothetical protein
MPPSYSHDEEEGLHTESLMIVRPLELVPSSYVGAA